MFFFYFNILLVKLKKHRINIKKKDFIVYLTFAWLGENNTYANERLFGPMAFTLVKSIIYD